MTSDGPDRPPPTDEGSDDQDDEMFHGADVPDEPDRPAPGDDDSGDEDDQMFHIADVPDDDG
jgi:hypothetical protein